MTDDERRLARARTVAELLDSSIRLPVVGVRVGLDPLVGLVPFAGDSAVVLASLYVVWQGVQIGVPRSTLLRMLLNVGADAAVGSVPLVGDVLDVGWRANERNVSLLERHVESA